MVSLASLILGRFFSKDVLDSLRRSLIIFCGRQNFWKSYRSRPAWTGGYTFPATAQLSQAILF
jgi:hypothetical protein